MLCSADVYGFWQLPRLVGAIFAFRSNMPDAHTVSTKN
jgi:hypothetical protein